MDTAFAAALFVVVFGPLAWMVRAELQRLREPRARVAAVRPSPARRHSIRGAAHSA
jgi:hypothetical protein